MANNKIQVTALDFDTIKDNLKGYLRGQEKFSDYDFDGSGLSILLDVLAYNTHYNALYNNLAVNEAFLDSASKRASVVSKAKELGYVPMSSRSATATVKVVMINNQVDAPQTMEIPRYTRFNTTIDGQQYSFYTQDAALAYKQGNQYVFDSVTIKEGTLLSYKWNVDGSINEFQIPNPGIDTSTLIVAVQDTSQSSTFSTYTNATSMLNVSADSLVYFLKEISGNYHVIEFGNGVVGKQLSPGNVISASYMIGNEDRANGARSFQYAGGAINNTQVFVSTIDPAFGGSAAEDLESIKWNAPRQFAAQNRCVTLDDYRSIIYSLYPNAESINVWGGEQNTPPSYGDVFISVKPVGTDALSDAEKDFLLNDILGPRRIVTLHPKIVDASYIRVELNTSFYYTPTSTTRSANDIAFLVRDAVANYNQSILSKFGGILKYSVLSKAIDAADESIVSSISTIKLHVDVEPAFNQSVQYTIDLGNPIHNSGSPDGSVISTGVYVSSNAQPVYFEDLPVGTTGNGYIRMFYYIGNDKVIIKNVGTINYTKGLIKINDVIITGLASPSFLFVIKPKSNDVVSARNQIVTIPPELVTVTPVVDITTPDNYQFTSSRN